MLTWSSCPRVSDDPTVQPCVGAGDRCHPGCRWGAGDHRGHLDLDELRLRVDSRRGMALGVQDHTMVGADRDRRQRRGSRHRVPSAPVRTPSTSPARHPVSDSDCGGVAADSPFHPSALATTALRRGAYYPDQGPDQGPLAWVVAHRQGACRLVDTACAPGRRPLGARFVARSRVVSRAGANRPRDRSLQREKVVSDRLNRVVLGLLGLLLLAGGGLFVCLGPGVFGSNRSHRDVFDATVVRWWNEGGWMSFAVVVAIGLGFLVLGLWL